MQGLDGQFFIQHCCSFGATASESNSGQISKAVLRIWDLEGIGPNGKWSDDVYIFAHPTSGDGSTTQPFEYGYDEQKVLDSVSTTNTP